MVAGMVVQDDEGVDMAEQVQDGPVERLLAAGRLVYVHPIFCTASLPEQVMIIFFMMN